jgi:putative glutamine amidotransferase
MSHPSSSKARVGIPYRTRNEELTAKRGRFDYYLEAVRQAGGEPVEISLGLSPADLRSVVAPLDAFVLPGSPADIEPSRFGARRHPKTADSDPDRERTDDFLLDHAFAGLKPVLAICYGLQSLNVFLGGSLVQDIPSEIRTGIQHPWPAHSDPEPFHSVALEPGSRLAELAGGAEARVNSSHHQSLLAPGRGLRITARASDGVVEAAEGTGDAHWLTAVQWHPERMVAADLLARSLFSELVAAARRATVNS